MSATAITKPTPAEVAAHLREGWGGSCLVCGDKPARVAWTDYNGQAFCFRCGATYQLNGCRITPEALREVHIDRQDVAQRYCDMFTFVPVARAYWQDTAMWYPWGTWVSTPPREYDPKSMRAWLQENAERVRPAYEAEFLWGKVLEAPR